jgi:hypothetical protein
MVADINDNAGAPGESPYHHSKMAKPSASEAEEVLVPRKRDLDFYSSNHPSSSTGPELCWFTMTCSTPSTTSWKKPRTTSNIITPFGGNYPLSDMLPAESNWRLGSRTFDGRGASGVLPGSNSCELLDEDTIMQTPPHSSPAPAPALVLPVLHQKNNGDLISANTATATVTAATRPQQHQAASFLEGPKQESQNKGTLANSSNTSKQSLSVSMEDTTFSSIDHQTSNASNYCHKDDDEEKSSVSLRFRSYQADNWTGKFEELLVFRLKHGHCLVPYVFTENSSLAEWVKRQRHQYKLKNEGKHSALSQDRIEALEAIGFVWNSHDAVWEERWKELHMYKNINSNCNVPSKYVLNPQLAVWVKRQRRQYKFYSIGKPSTMNPYRIEKLEKIRFAWDGRKPENY